MFKVEYGYSGKNFDLEPYNTLQEKQILLLNMISPNANNILDLALDILNFKNIDKLTEDEKIAILYKYRSISIGDEVQIKFKCKYCQAPNESGLNIDNIIEDSNIKNEYIKDAFKELTEENLQDFLNIDIGEIDIDKFEELYEEVENSITKFNFIKPCQCIKCKKDNFFNIKNSIIDNLSEDTIISLYQTYNDLVFFGKYTKQDIDTLYPFERIILIGLLNKTREELSK